MFSLKADQVPKEKGTQLLKSEKKAYLLPTGGVSSEVII